LTIETYDNPSAYATNLHPFVDPNTLKLVLANGTTVEFNEAAMDFEVITLKGKQEIIVVNYPTSQLATTMTKIVNGLRLVS
jgi:hypothetical protein